MNCCPVDGATVVTVMLRSKAWPGTKNTYSGPRRWREETELRKVSGCKQVSKSPSVARPTAKSWMSGLPHVPVSRHKSTKQSKTVGGLLLYWNAIQEPTNFTVCFNCLIALRSNLFKLGGKKVPPIKESNQQVLILCNPKDLPSVLRM